MPAGSPDLIHIGRLAVNGDNFDREAGPFARQSMAGTPWPCRSGSSGKVFERQADVSTQVIGERCSLSPIGSDEITEPYNSSFLF